MPQSLACTHIDNMDSDVILTGDGYGHIGVHKIALEHDEYTYTMLHQANIHAGKGVRKV